MLTRVLIILACVVVFINGCNSLISQVAGTHRLRSYTIEEVEYEGVGDADYVEIRGGWQTGDFLYGEPRRESQRGIVQYPVVSEFRYRKRQGGENIPLSLVAWRAEFDPPCVAADSCAPVREVVLRGLVRRVPPRGDRLEALPDLGYELTDYAVFVEAGRQPLAWYWNTLMMAGALALALGIEWWHARKKSKTTKQQSI